MVGGIGGAFFVLSCESFFCCEAMALAVFWWSQRAVYGEAYPNSLLFYSRVGGRGWLVVVLVGLCHHDVWDWWL